MSSTGRRVGREALVEAGIALLDEGTLPDVTAWIGVRSVADRAGVSPSTVSHHFSPNGDRRAPNGALARTVVQRGLQIGYEATDHSRTRIAEVAALGAMGAELTNEIMATVAAADVETWITPQNRPALTARYLASAAAPNDADARALLLERDERTRDRMVPLYDAVVDALDRAWVSGWDAEAFAITASSMAEGFILRDRFKPGLASPSMFGDAIVRLLNSVTVDRVANTVPDAGATNPATRLPRGSNLDPHKRDAIAAAAIRLYDERGWSDITLASVATAAGVNRATVAAHFGAGWGLAGPIFARHVAPLAAAIDTDRASTLLGLITNHLERMAAIADQHRGLTAAFLASLSEHAIEGRYAPEHPGDPRNIVPLPDLLVSLISRDPAQFRPGLVDSPGALIQFATFATRSCLSFAVGQPSVRPSGIADFLHDTVLSGALIDRPAPRSAV
jgi:AcrR family transcriptional regulator